MSWMRGCRTLPFHWLRAFTQQETKCLVISDLTITHPLQVCSSMLVNFRNERKVARRTYRNDTSVVRPTERHIIQRNTSYTIKLLRIALFITYSGSV